MNIHMLCEVLERSLSRRYPEIQKVGLYFAASNNSLFLSDMYVKPRHRGKGIGTRLMNEIAQFADDTKLPIVLIPEEDSAPKKRLITFYKKFGFVVNTGKKMDYSLSIPFVTSMVRHPKKN